MRGANYNVAALTRDGRTISTQLWDADEGAVKRTVLRWVGNDPKLRADSPVVIASMDTGDFIFTTVSRVTRRGDPTAERTPTVVVADWKDTRSLVEGIAAAVKPYGVTLQQWDAGSDDTIVSVAERRLGARQAGAALEWTGDPLEEVR